MISLIGIPIDGHIVDYIPEINFSGGFHKQRPNAGPHQLLQYEHENISRAQRTLENCRPMACSSTNRRSFKCQRLQLRDRMNLTTEQHAFLESEFQKNPKWNKNEISRLAIRFGHDIGKIQNWFRNRRQKYKKELLRSQEMITQSITPPEMVNTGAATHTESAPRNVFENCYEPVYSPITPISPATSDSSLPDSRFVQDASLLTPLSITFSSPPQSVENPSCVQDNSISTHFDSNMLTPESITSPSSVQDNIFSTSFDDIIFSPKIIENQSSVDDDSLTTTFENNTFTPQIIESPNSLHHTSFKPLDNNSYQVEIENTNSNLETSYSTLFDNIVFSPKSMQILEDILF